jgi:hypothetical protein
MINENEELLGLKTPEKIVLDLLEEVFCATKK